MYLEAFLPTIRVEKWKKFESAGQETHMGVIHQAQRTRQRQGKEDDWQQGTGYASPLQQASSTATRTSVRRSAHFTGSSTSMRRAGSVGNVSASSSTSSRVPLVPQPGSYAGSRVNRYTTGNGSASTEQTIICNCQHPADVTFLENVYVQNLQTQIEVLELENNYLRSGGSGTQPKSILREDLQQQQRRHSESVYQSSSQQPSSSSATHQKMQQDSSAYLYSGSGGRKKVGFMEQEAHVVNSAGSHTPSPGSYEYETGGAAHVSDGGASTSSQQHYPKLHHQQQESRQRFQDEDLFLKLEQAFQNEHLLEERLKNQMAENRKLSLAKSDLEDRLHSMEGRMSKERRSLMEDGVELQRRLDELTPLLAEKEAMIAKLDNEREELGSRLRSANLKISSLQARIDERKREESLYSELNSDRKQEIERLREKLRAVEETLEEKQSRENSMIDEISSLRQRLKEEESAVRHQRALCEKSTHENTELAKDNSQLASRIRRFEQQLEHQQQDLSARRKCEAYQREVEELQRTEKSLRGELQSAEERVRREQDKMRTITLQERERVAKEEEYRETRQRIQHELEALQALSHSLASENKGLREERIAVDERLEYLQNKLLSKENDILDLTEKLEDFKRKYTETSNRLRLEITRFSERSVELEEIVKRVHELSDSIPRRSSSQGFRPLLSPLKCSPKEQQSPKPSSRQLEGSSTEIVSASRISSREYTEGRTMSETHIGTNKNARKSPSSLPQPATPSYSSEGVGRSRKGKETSSSSTTTGPKYSRPHRRSSVASTSRKESTDDETNSVVHRDELAQKYRRKIS